jgi:hypothetical protein
MTEGMIVAKGSVTEQIERLEVRCPSPWRWEGLGFARPGSTNKPRAAAAGSRDELHMCATRDATA